MQRTQNSQNNLGKKKLEDFPYVIPKLEYRQIEICINGTEEISKIDLHIFIWLSEFNKGAKSIQWGM